MKEFKSIITHPEGQNLFPGQITAIEGYPHGTSITMKNTKPQIALTPYGASYMQPDMEYKFAGNTVVELPHAQMGGQDQQQQLMQMIQMYAEMKGMKPEELIQKIQSLPQDQQQQAIQSIAQEVQQAMAEQQQAQQQQGMMGQQGEEGMGQEEQMMEQGMMSHGGEPCIECFDHYNPSPQAQDLNWYYKATGGEAFPQANMYPEDWASYSGNQYQKGKQVNNSSKSYFPTTKNLIKAGTFGALSKDYWELFKQNNLGIQPQQHLEDGGEAFPQAQTYLPNDRPHETRPNFMFQTGGQSDIDQIYKIMKKGGMDYNPKKKKGGKFDHLKAFNEYLQGGGGKLPYKDINVAEDNYNQMMDERERKDMEPMQSNAYSNMKGNAWLDTLKNTTLDSYWDQPTSDNKKPELTGPAYDTEDEDMDWVANPFAEAESQFNDMQKDFGDGEPSDNNSTTKTDNNSNAAENYQKGKRSSYDKMMQANMLNGAAAMTGNKGLFGAIAAVNNIGRAVGAAAQGWSHPGRAFGRQAKADRPVYGKGFNRLDHSDMMQNGVGPKPESTLNKKVPALDTDRYNLNQNDVYDYSNISGSTQMQDGGNTQDPRYHELERFPKHNPGWGSYVGWGDRKKNKTKTVNPHQKEAGPKRHKPTGSCVAGNCYEFQDGGPNVYVTSDQSDSYFNPLSGDIYLNEDQSHIPGVLPHEMHHYDQWVNGNFKVPGGVYMGEENLPESLNPYLPLMMPSIVRDENFEGQMPYYNRRPIEQVATTNDFLYSNPSFSLVDPGLVYDKAVNPSLYTNPYTLEGEAQIVGDQYMGPFQRGGGLPQHQGWLSQVGKHWQDQYSPNNATANQIVNKQVKGADPNEKWSGEPDFALGDSLVAGMGQAADFIKNFKERNNPKKDFERRNTKTSEFMDVAQFGGGQYGDWSTNATQGTSFRPDEMVYAQKMGRPYKDVIVRDYPTNDFKDMFQSGGSVLDNYEEDGEYDLTQEEIDEIIAAGGTIEYL